MNILECISPNPQNGDMGNLNVSGMNYLYDLPTQDFKPNR